MVSSPIASSFAAALAIGVEAAEASDEVTVGGLALDLIVLLGPPAAVLAIALAVIEGRRSRDGGSGDGGARDRFGSGRPEGEGPGSGFRSVEDVSGPSAGGGDGGGGGD